MVARSCFVSFILLITGAAFASPDRSLENSGATVLCYHVVESPHDTRFAISRESFRQQMQYLAASGYSVISLSDLQQYVAGKKESIPHNSVVLTVDDGWRCTYTEIYPELKRFRFPFTVFLYPKFIGQGAYALTWKQVKEMADEGVDIQSHTFSHAYLTHRRQSRLDRHSYGNWLENELATSKKVIEQETGRQVSFLAYPYGDYDSTVAKSASKAGYDAALTCDYGRVHKGSDPLRMKRVIVDNTTTFSSFRRSLGVGSMLITEVLPSRGRVFDPTSPIISARLPEFLSLDPSSVGMAIISQGAAPSSYDPRNGTISMVVREPLQGNHQRVVIWANRKDSGKRVEASWSFYLTKPADPPPAQSAEKPAPANVEAEASRPPLPPSGGQMPALRPAGMRQPR